VRTLVVALGGPRFWPSSKSPRHSSSTDYYSKVGKAPPIRFRSVVGLGPTEAIRDGPFIVAVKGGDFLTVPYTFHMNDIISFPFEGWNLARVLLNE
jgi:hypothetical protein